MVTVSNCLKNRWFSLTFNPAVAFSIWSWYILRFHKSVYSHVFLVEINSRVLSNKWFFMLFECLIHLNIKKIPFKNREKWAHCFFVLTLLLEGFKNEDRLIVIHEMFCRHFILMFYSFLTTIAFITPIKSFHLYEIGDFKLPFSENITTRDCSGIRKSHKASFCNLKACFLAAWMIQ